MAKRKGTRRAKKSGVRTFAETNQIARRMRAAESKFAGSTGIKLKGGW